MYRNITKTKISNKNAHIAHKNNIVRFPVFQYFKQNIYLQYIVYVLTTFHSVQYPLEKKLATYTNLKSNIGNSMFIFWRTIHVHKQVAH